MHGIHRDWSVGSSETRAFEMQQPSRPIITVCMLSYESAEDPDVQGRTNELKAEIH